MEFQVGAGLCRAIFVVCCLGFIFQNNVYADASATPYQLGRGYRISNSGIQLGGYGTIALNGFGTIPWGFQARNLSLFTSWSNGKRFSFFSELEIEDFFTAGENQGLSTRDANLELERLYFDYLFTDSFAVRLGKMLTPVGQWNLIHADPLVWTTTRPVATTNLFPVHAAGLMLQGSILVGEQSLDYMVYGDYDSVFDREPKGTLGFDNAAGFHLRYGLSNTLQVGLSYLNFALVDSAAIRHNLVGLDFAWDYRGISLTSELVYRQNNAPFNNRLWQGYLQGVIPVTESWYAIARYEFFDQAIHRLGQVAVLGLAYRPITPLTVKLEYRLGENNQDLAPQGLYTSLAVLF